MTGGARGRLDGRVAVVTGATRGMGPAIARALAEEGAHVVLAARTQAHLDAVARSLADAHLGRRILGVPADVASARSVEELATRVLAEFGRIDILVNAAGITGPIETPLHLLSVEDWDEVLDVNLRGVFLCCRAVVPAMMPRRYGKIVNISGTAGLRGYRNRAAYSVSKWGVRSLTRTLALEVGAYNINVNAICPGPVESERITKVATEKARRRGVSVDEVLAQEYVGALALGRMSAGTDIANAVIFLASDESRQITGHDLIVDGGWDV